MKRGTSPIWEPARDALKKTIARQAEQPNTEFAIVAFKDKSVIPNTDILTFEGSDYNHSKQAEIDSLFNREINGPQEWTNIVSALKKGFAICSPTMENRIYLFTDGLHNRPGTGTPEECINDWCGNHSKGNRLFYVMMTKEAVDSNVMQILDTCDDAFSVKCHNGFIPQIVDIGSHINASTYELDHDYAISFSESVNLPIDIECDDPAFDVKLIGRGAANNKIRMRFVPKGDLSPDELNQKLSRIQMDEDYEFMLNVMSTNKDYFIANPEVLVTIKNLPPRKLQLFEGKTEALTIPKVKWYDNFLWSSAKAEQPVEIDFSPVFDTQDNQSAITFTFQETKDNPNDYILMYNGDTLKSGQPFTIYQQDTIAKLTFVFNHDAKEGRRGFVLTPAKVDHLDIINDMSAREFPAIAINMSYNRYWNPLKTVCFWLLVIIIAVLLLWFLIAKPQIYPKIDVTRLQITGTGVYVNKRIKGCRRVVLSNKKCKQSLLSRLFTGKIMYVVDNAFIDNIRIEKTTKHCVRFYVSAPWTIVPAPVVKKKQSATLKDTGTNKEYRVSVY